MLILGPCLDGGIMCVCREGAPCYENNSQICGTCVNNVCVEPDCCSDVDCNVSKHNFYNF